MEETTVGPLALATTQLGMLTDRLCEGGVTAEDLAPVAIYLTALTEHGFQIASLAICARPERRARPPHPQ